MITVIATGFSETESSRKNTVSPSRDVPSRPQTQGISRREQNVQEEPKPSHDRQRQHSEDTLDIPTFLRNRNRR
jgi:cell division protein FtsZ